MRPDNLQPNGQARFAEAAGERNRWQSPHIERAGVAQQYKLSLSQPVRICLEIGNGRSGNCCRRGHENVDLLKHLTDIATYSLEFPSTAGNFRRRGGLTPEDASERFRMIELGRTGNELRVVSVRLGVL